MPVEWRTGEKSLGNKWRMPSRRLWRGRSRSGENLPHAYEALPTHGEWADCAGGSYGGREPVDEGGAT